MLCQQTHRLAWRLAAIDPRDCDIFSPGPPCGDLIRTQSTVMDEERIIANAAVLFALRPSCNIITAVTQAVDALTPCFELSSLDGLLHANHAFRSRRLPIYAPLGRSYTIPKARP